ncbi:MAG: helix-turn-helix transcriptional regulator [Nocardioides sp.]
MPTIPLDEPRQVALSALLALEPATGDRFPDRRTLEATARLIPCDAISLGVLDVHTGAVLRSVSVPQCTASLHTQTLDDTCLEGIHHELDDPRLRPLLLRSGMSDGLLLCFRDGRDRVVEVWLDRRHRPFTDSDITLLHIIAPLLRRLLRDRPVTQVPVDLTAQERRVLGLVATGMSNADVAARMSVEPCTVRKHLEHAFRKLGVSNRLAAVQAFEGRPVDDSDQEQIFA